jgi:hypothetical protein
MLSNRKRRGVLLFKAGEVPASIRRRGAAPAAMKWSLLSCSPDGAGTIALGENAVGSSFTQSWGPRDWPRSPTPACIANRALPQAPGAEYYP